MLAAARHPWLACGTAVFLLCVSRTVHVAKSALEIRAGQRQPLRPRLRQCALRCHRRRQGCGSLPLGRPRDVQRRLLSRLEVAKVRTDLPSRHTLASYNLLRKKKLGGQSRNNDAIRAACGIFNYR